MFTPGLGTTLTSLGICIRFGSSISPEIQKFISSDQEDISGLLQPVSSKTELHFDLLINRESNKIQRVWEGLIRTLDLVKRSDCLGTVTLGGLSDSLILCL